MIYFIFNRLNLPRNDDVVGCNSHCSGITMRKSILLYLYNDFFFSNIPDAYQTDPHSVV